MKNHHLMVKRIFMVLLITATLFSCKKDIIQQELIPENHSSHSSSKLTYVTPGDIPEVMEFIFEESGNDNEFELQDKSINKSFGPLEPVTIDTSIIVESTNDYDRSNYSFKAESLTDNQSIIQYIVKETMTGFYSYFLRFRPSEDYLLNHNTLDMDYYDGEIVIYKSNGDFVAMNIYSNGTATSREVTDPCDSDGGDSGDNGGTGDTGDHGDTGDTGDSDSSDSSDSDTNGGYLIEIARMCGCPPAHEGGRANPHCSCDLADIILYVTINKSFEGPDPIQTKCADDECVVDCEFGIGPDCSCLGDPNDDANQNSDIGIIPDLMLFLNLERQIPLTDAQRAWIRASEENHDVAYQLLELLQEDGTQEGKDGAMMLLESLRTNKLEGPYDDSYYDLINSFTEVDLETLDPLWAAHFSLQCALIKFENPDWPLWKVYWHAAKEMIHLGLDIVGMAPLIGEVCDVLNGVIYTLEGDGLNASLSFAAAIPFAGWFATGAKFAFKSVEITASSATKLKWTVTAANFIDFGRRSQLRKVLNLPVGDPRQAHHLIPWGKRNEAVIQKAAKGNNPFHMNDLLNGVAVAAWRNQPNHNLYDARVQALLDNIPSHLDANATMEALESVITTIRNAVENNPTVHLNDLIF